ncbi:MAG: AAA family ATPase [Thermoproteota archaeon]
MLTKIAIENFKSIGKRIELELKPLTILVGENASGKSSILEALCLLVQSIWSSGYDIFGNRYPSFVKYPGLRDIAHKNNLKNPISIEVHVKPNEKEKEELLEIAKKINSSNLEILIDGEIKSIGYRYSYSVVDSFAFVEQEVFCNEKKIIAVGTKRLSESSFVPVFTFPPILKDTRINGPIDSILNYATFEQQPEPTGKIPREPAKPLNDFAVKVVKIIVSKLRPESYKSKVYFLSAQRGEIEPEISTAMDYYWVGKKGEYLLVILSKVSAPENEQKKKKIAEWALKFGIENPWAGWVGSNKASGEFVDAKLKHPLNLAFASFGSSQILTVITQLFWSEEGDIILIEEPEISIHPKGQAMLPELFADAIMEGKQVIITTHSGYLPLALTRALKKGLKVEDIAVYEVTKDGEGTKVKKKEINERGYIKGYIDSFYEVEEELAKDWAKSIKPAEE